MKRPCEMTPEELRAHKNAIQRAWIKKNPERARELSRKGAEKRKEWRLNNKDRLTAWRKKWREENRSRINQLSREKSRANKERYREYTYKWRDKNRARFDEVAKRYRSTHLEQLTIHRRNHRRANREQDRRVRKIWESKNKGKLNAICSNRRAITKKSAVENPELIKRFYVNAKRRKFNTCYYCNRVFSGAPDIDHIVPISKGGKHAIENLCVSCEFCNCSKHNKLISEWKRNGQQVLPI